MNIRHVYIRGYSSTFSSVMKGSEVGKGLDGANIKMAGNNGNLYNYLYVIHCKKEIVILTLLRLSQLQLNAIMSPPH